MPVLPFVIVFGLSMGYEVFLLSRIKELHDVGVEGAGLITGAVAARAR